MMSKSMNRVCPNCSRRRIPVSSLILSRAYCPVCDTLIGVKRTWAILFFLVTFGVTAVSVIAILAQQGFYAALIWLPLPIGALGYIKARYCPLQVKSGPLEPVAPYDQEPGLE